MTIASTILAVLTSAVLGLWTSRHFMVSSQRRKGFVLTPDYGAGAAEPPPLSVVVAAKDEQANIGGCIGSLLEQDYPHLDVIVVNDRSVDRTGEIVSRLAEQDGRLKLINIGELPAGWCGKNHAMQTGIAEARSAWICMTDADCRQTSPRSLRAAMAYALDQGADMLSVLPNLDMKGFWENVVQPVCGGIMMIWFHPDKVNDPHSPVAYANGAFMVIRRAAYQRIGTHEAVKDKVNEDIHLAGRIKRAGLGLRVVRNRGLYLVRMYTSLREIVRGWARIFYGTFGTFRRLIVSLAVLAVLGLLPYAAAIIGLGAAALGGSAGPRGGALWACGLIGLAAAAMQISVIHRFYRLIGARPAMAWTYPLGCIIGIVALVQAMTKLREGALVAWRGTTYTHRGTPSAEDTTAGQ